MRSSEFSGGNNLEIIEKFLFHQYSLRYLVYSVFNAVGRKATLKKSLSGIKFLKTKSIKKFRLCESEGNIRGEDK